MLLINTVLAGPSFPLNVDPNGLPFRLLGIWATNHDHIGHALNRKYEQIDAD